MAVTPDLLNKISFYENKGYTPDEIVAGIKASGKYSDVVSKMDAYAKQGYGADEMLQGIRQSGGNASEYRGDTSGRSVADMQKEFIKREGTLKTRMANTSLKDAVKNVALEAPRLAQEMVTVPINSAIKGAYGIGGLAKTGAELYRGKSLDDALQAGTEVINARPQVSGPLDSSMVGEGIGAGVETVDKALPDNTFGDVARGGIEATMDIAGLVGGGKVLANTAKGAVNGVKNARILSDPAIQALSETYKIPVTVGELTNKPSIQLAESGLDQAPIIGTGKFRKRQSEALKTAADDLVQKYDTGVADVPEAIQQKMLDKLNQGKKAQKSAYDRVEAEVAMSPQGTAPVMLDNLRASATTMLSEFPEFFDSLTNNSIKSKLKAIVNDTAPETVQSGLYDAAGNPITRQVPVELTFKEARSLRDGIKDLEAKAYADKGAVAPREAGQLTALKKAVEADLEQWGTNPGNANVLAALENAKKVHAEQVAPFKEHTIRKATGREFDTDALINTFIKGDRPQLASKLMNTLDAEGQQLVRYAVLKRAMDAGLDTKPEVPFSPAKFAGVIDALDSTKKSGAGTSTIDSVFGADAKLIRGYAQIAKVAERAGQFAENPSTGLRAGLLGGGAAAGIAAFTNPLATLTTAGATKLLSTLLTTETGRKLLTRAATTPPRATGAWKSIMSGIDNFIPNKLKDQRGMVGKDINYKMEHRPVTDAGGAARLHDLEPAFGPDIYGKNALQYFGGNEPRLERQVLSVFNAVKGNPDAVVTIYRAVPKGAKPSFNNGDWVTVNKDYAKQHGEGYLNGDYKIIEQKVKAADLTTNADSILEQGYYPQGGNQ